MKKRSLFAAVAMLIVSAIVLTSATYAWFQANGAVTVASFSGTTTAQTGGLVVSTTGNNNTWKSDLSATDYEAAGGNKLLSGGSFIPVSGNVSSGIVTLKAGSLSGTTFTYSGEASTGYIQYTTYVMSPNVDGTINVAPTLTAISGGSALAPFIYYAASVTNVAAGGGSVNNSYFANATTGARAYLAITGGSDGSTHQDADGSGVLSTTEAANLTTANMTSDTQAFSQQNAQTALSFPCVAGQAYKIVVTVWAEGQDFACVAGAAASSAQVGLELSLS